MLLLSSAFRLGRRSDHYVTHLFCFQVRPFKLFPDYGEVTVSLKPSVPLNDDIDLDIVQKFHCLLFSHVLRTLVEVHPGSVDASSLFC